MIELINFTFKDYYRIKQILNINQNISKNLKNNLNMKV